MMKKILCALLAVLMLAGGAAFALAGSAAPALTNVVTPQIAVSGSHILALRSDGTVWGWGWNDWGGLGCGTHDPDASIVSVK